MHRLLFFCRVSRSGYINKRCKMHERFAMHEINFSTMHSTVLLTLTDKQHIREYIRTSVSVRLIMIDRLLDRPKRFVDLFTSVPFRVLVTSITDRWERGQVNCYYELVAVCLWNCMYIHRQANILVQTENFLISKRLNYVPYVYNLTELTWRWFVNRNLFYLHGCICLH